MIDLILQVGATKLMLSLVLAGVAWTVSRRVDRPELIHLLWLLVLGSLMMPAVVSLPVPGIGAESIEPAGATAGGGAALGGIARTLHWAWAKPVVLLLWALGTGLIVLWSLAQTLRFHRMLRRAARPAGAELQAEAASLGKALGLATVPVVHTSTADISPLVWWIGGQVRVVLPVGLVATLASQELRWILGHELAHVARRDHQVRWVEWLTCALFWWNPVTWWARRELRSAEEMSCDARVLDACSADPRGYAGSLVTVIEFLSARPAHRAPVFASAVAGGTGATLVARRLQMILTAPPRSRVSRRGRRMVRPAAALFLTLGLIYCTPDQATAPSESAELELALPTKDESLTLTELQNVAGLGGWTLASRLGVAGQLRKLVAYGQAKTLQAAEGHEVADYVEVALLPTRDGRVPLRKEKLAAEHRATLVELAPDAAPAVRRLPFKVAERVVSSEGIKPPKD